MGSMKNDKVSSLLPQDSPPAKPTSTKACCAVFRMPWVDAGDPELNGR